MFRVASIKCNVRTIISKQNDIQDRLNVAVHMIRILERERQELLTENDKLVGEVQICHDRLVDSTRVCTIMVISLMSVCVIIGIMSTMKICAKVVKIIFCDACGSSCAGCKKSCHLCQKPYRLVL